MLTIGEFSSRGRISARMLRHYDALGLLRPDHVGENGYRYYGEAQLAALGRIEMLKAYGFTLAEIRDLLPLQDAELARRMHAKRLAAYRELSELRQRLHRMESDILRMEETGFMEEAYEIKLLQEEAQQVFALRKTINISETQALFDELLQHAAQAGHTPGGVTQLLYHGRQFSYESMDVEAQLVVTDAGPGVKQQPGGRFACADHRGPYESLRYAYDALGAWVAAHPEYRVCGPAIERYIKNYDQVADKKDLETLVLFPVCLEK